MTVIKMAKYLRRQDLIESSLAFQMFGKRLCDLTYSENKEYYRIRKQISRQKESIQQNEKDYRVKHWIKTREEKLKCQEQN